MKRRRGEAGSRNRAEGVPSERIEIAPKASLRKGTELRRRHPFGRNWKSEAGYGKGVVARISTLLTSPSAFPPSPISLSLLLLLSLTACFEPKEGCLDINAVNYAVDADEPCSGCCQYPVLRLDFLHKTFPGSNANLQYLDTVYQDGAGNDFRFRSIQFYLSDIRLVRSDGEEVGVTDTIWLRIPAAEGDTINEVVEDNFALVNPADFGVMQIGTFLSKGTFNKIKFTLGLSGPANLVDPVTLPEEHPLANEQMYWGPDSGHIYNRIDLFRIPEPEDTVITLLEIGTPENLMEVELEFDDTPLYLDPGFIPKVIIRIDYLTWFRGVNLDDQTNEEIAQKIVQNLTDSFSVVEVEQQEQ